MMPHENEAPVKAPQMLGLEEIVARLDCTENHVRRIARDGRLQAFVIGHTIKTTEADLAAYIESTRKPRSTARTSQPPARPRTSVTQNIAKAGLA